ncbi:MAG: hypothetical protein ACOX46_00985 [Limnochordia bacterium]|jgi:hypothetical protein|nr:hypothetical protein [Bacillota bacterium]NLL08169.1 hypothetical protein [Bacillota bacterium]HBG08930.1 hypothetical protein [Bacillota bacterium]
MSRKLPIVVLSVVVVLSCSMLAWAQDLWNYNVFPYDYEKFVYEVINYTKSWDWDTDEEIITEKKSIQVTELRKLDGENHEVTQSFTNVMESEKLFNELSFLGGLSGLSLLMSGDWFAEMMFVGLWAADLDLEVGNTMQTFDGSRVRVVEEQTVAGVKGYLVRKSIRETDDEGNRVDILTSEWVIAPNVGWPLKLVMYSEGEVVSSMTLIEYERR